MKKLLLLLLPVLLIMCSTALADVGGICAGGYDNFSHGYATLTGDGASDIVKVAQAQVGRDNGSFRYHSGGWCAAFVNDCAYLAGQASSIPFISGSTHAVGGLINAVLNAGGTWVSNPQAGDLVLYYCTNDGVYCHVGIMENGSSSIQGNVANACKRLASPWYYRDGYYNANYPNTTGTCYNVSYLRPNYKPAKPPADLGASFTAKIYLVQDNKAIVATNTGNIELDSNRNVAGQDWLFEQMENGSYIITNLRDGRVMDLAGGGTTNGTNISLCTRHPAGSSSLIYQKWFIYENGGYYRLCPEAMPLRSLDANGGYTTDGTNIQLYDTNDTIAQRIKIDIFGGAILKGITCSETELLLREGESEQLTISYVPLQEVPINRRGINWSSSNEDVASVNASGLVSAHGEGSCTITATSAYNDLYSAACAITVESGVRAPEITGLAVSGRSVFLSWNQSPAMDENDVRAYEVFVYPKGNTDDYVWSDWDIAGTSCEIALNNHGEYTAYVRAINKTDGTRSRFSSKTFTVLDGEWLYFDELPDDLPDGEIQYLNRYNDRQQENSPGEGWTRGPGKTTYVNGNVLYSEDPTRLQESDTLVYLGTFYYHYCDGSGTVEHYWTNRFCNHTRMDNYGQFDIAWQGTDDIDPRYTVYRLKWNSGQWAGGLATCAYGSSNAMALYYLGHRYQERTAVTSYTWSKEAEWSNTQDPNADSVSYRVRDTSEAKLLRLPTGTVKIEAEAFMNNTAIQEVLVPAGCEYIGSRAFAGCTNLERIYIPRDTVVENDALAGCTQVQIVRIGE